MKFCFILIFFLVICVTANSQSVHSSFGLNGGLNYNLISSSFSELPGFSKPPATFSAINAIGLNLGVYYQLPISERVYILPRLSYFQSPSQLEAFEPTTFIINGNPVPGTFRHTISAQLSSISFEALLGYRLFSSFDIFGGASIGYFIGKGFTQEEEIFSPDSVRFLPGITTRNPRSGEIPSMSLQSFAIGGFRNTFIKNSYEIVPELTYHFPFQSLTSAVDWKLSSIRLGVSLGKILPKDSIIKKPLMQLYDTVYVRDTVIKSTNDISSSGLVKFDRIKNRTTNLVSLNEGTNTERYRVSVEIQYIQFEYLQEKKTEKIFKEKPDFVITKDPQGLEVVETAVTIYRKIQKVSIPVLPFIFFEQNSSEIPSRYKRTSKVESSINSLENYYSILSVVALRLKENPTTTVTISGYTSNETTAEQSLELSKARAESVKNALVSLGANPSQIELKNGLLPPKNSRNESEFGHAENRRVELSSTNNTILAPIVIQKVYDDISQTPLYLKPTLNNTQFKKQEFEIMYNEEYKKYDISMLELVDKKSATYRFPISLLTNSVFDNNTIKQNEVSVSLISTSSDTTETSTKSIKVIIKDTSIVENEVLSVLLFDYDSAEITEQMRQQLQSYTSRDFTNKTLKFIGTTDVIGSPQYNKELSLKRANSISTLFSGKKEIIGFGPDDTTYNNNLPEGRFYSRTVKIEIR
ncbi:MAG: OmpA family protein [Candidatus Kapabacteria bacterium]|nr:OmpA family protein [Candidatus Kapabacteria bacterium]